MNTNKLLLVFIGIVCLSVGSKDSNSVSNTLNNQTKGISDADSLFNLKNQINFPTISENETPNSFSNLTGNLTRSKRSGTPDITFNLTSYEIQRFKRAADPLSDYSGKLSTVARISNGISLLAGLINKNIPIDTVISELLHFGNAKLSEVLALQKDKVESAISQLETTKKSLHASTEVITLEKITIGMGRVRQVFIESDFGTFQYPTDYFTEAQSFKDDKTDLSGFQTAKNAVVDALKKFDELPTIQDNVKDNKALVEDKITRIGNKLEELLTVSQQMSQIVNSVDSYSKLANGQTILKPVQQMLDLLAVHRSSPSVTADEVANAGKNMDALNSFSSTFASAQSAVTVLRDLVSARLKSSPTKRQLTTGFLNGASDIKLLVKDIRDPAFESTIGGGKNFARLSGGLKPLIDWLVKLEAPESALKPIATSEILQSARNAAELQKLTSGLTVSSEDAISVAQMLLDNKFDAIAEDYLTPIVKLMGNAGKLSKELAQVKSSASAFPQPPQEVTDVKEILKKLPVVNGPENVQEIVDELKGVPDKVKAVTEYLNKLQEFLKDVPDPTSTQKTAGLVLQADGDLKKLKAKVDRDVVSKLTVIKDSTLPFDSVVRALKASTVIRDFKKEDGTNINAALDAITKAASSIKDLQKPPANRKKRQTDEVKELVKLKDAQKTSAALGSAAITISSMAQLKGMEGTVQNLKISTIFDTEVAKVTDGSKKANILAKWGDHVAFTSSLGSTINQIKAFGAKLTVDKDLRKLGAHLNDAKAVGDVNQNIAEKSEAVSMLISETATPNADLEALKTQLDSLAALDLQFSNHHSAFPDVQGALKSFFDFVTGFVTPNPNNNGGPNGSSNNSTSDNFDFMILVYIGVTLVLLLIVGIVGYFVYVHFRDQKKPWAKIRALWIVPYLGKQHDGLTFAMGAWDSLRFVRSGNGYKDVSKMRREDEFNSKTRVKISNGFINANWVKVKGAPVFIATQGPLDGKEVVYKPTNTTKGAIRGDSGSAGKKDTREDFLKMVVETGAEYIVQLCKTEEDDLEFPGGDYLVQKAAIYFETGTYGRYEVTNNKEEDILDKEGIKRSLTIRDTKTGKEHNCHQLHWSGWPDHDVPGGVGKAVGKGVEKGVELMEMVNKSKKPIIVHCSMGMGRTASWIGIETIACDAQRHPKKQAYESGVDLRRMRSGSYQSEMQFHYSYMGALRLVVTRHGADLKNPKDEKTAVWREHLEVYDETMQGKKKYETVDAKNHRLQMREFDKAHALEAENVKLGKGEREKPSGEKVKSSEGSKEASKTPETSKTPEESKSAEPARGPAGVDNHVAINME